MNQRTKRGTGIQPLRQTLNRKHFDALTPAAQGLWRAAHMPENQISGVALLDFLQQNCGDSAITLSFHSKEKKPWTVEALHEGRVASAAHREPIAALWRVCIQVLGYILGADPCQPVPTTFGARLRAARVAKGLTQRELGKRIECGGSLIADYENDKGRPRRPRMSKLIRVLEVSEEYLEHGEGEEDISERARKVRMERLAAGGRGPKVGWQRRKAAGE